MSRSSIRSVLAVLLIFAITKAIVGLIGKPIVTPSTVIELSGPTSTPGGAWVIQKPEFSDFYCGPNAEVVSAWITLEISGGVPPYFVQFNSDNTFFEVNAAGIGFRLPGGTRAEVNVHDSQEGERNEDTTDVYVPTHHSACDVEVPTNTATVTVTSTATPTDTATPTPSMAPFHFRTPTRTRVNNNPPTNTPFIPTKTPSIPTNTPSIPTNTPIIPTNTPSIPTNTPSIPTNTPSIPTNTPIIPTNTPISGRPQCDDGLDNDGDTKVDKNDPQCQNKHDNDESS